MNLYRNKSYQIALTVIHNKLQSLVRISLWKEYHELTSLEILFLM